MYNDAWNKITQTHDTFKKIIAPLKQDLGINFGYMIVFNDGCYYQIIEDLECLKKWVTNVESSRIFCARNVTTYFDEPYNFTIWPEEPTCLAMKIYKEYGMWNGITVSKTNKDYTELYWFTKQNAENGWHKWFIRNKQALLKLINYFQKHKKTLRTPEDNTPEDNTKQELFKFEQPFISNILNSEYTKRIDLSLVKVIDSLKEDRIDTEKFSTTKLSPRELEVLLILCQGYTVKLIAQKLNIAPTTVQYYVERIKSKTGQRFKSDLIKLFAKNVLSP